MSVRTIEGSFPFSPSCGGWVQRVDTSHAFFWSRLVNRCKKQRSDKPTPQLFYIFALGSGYNNNNNISIVYV